MLRFKGRMVSGVGKMVGGKRAQAAGATAAKAVLNSSKKVTTPYGVIIPSSAKTAASKASANAMQASYISSGRRAMGITAGLGAAGSVGMYKNRDGSRGGYRAPSTRTPRGTGRYA